MSFKDSVANKGRKSSADLDSKYPVLLIGFNRPKEICERAEEFLSWGTSELYISIDGAKNNEDAVFSNEIRARLEKFQSDSRVNLIFRSRNYGLREHLPTAVDEVLARNEAVIVIEDDIRCTPAFYENLCNSLKIHGDQYMTIGGFSSLPFHGSFMVNRWRETKYFSAWGWGITRVSWSKYHRTIDLETFQSQLCKSAIWKTLNYTQRETWTGRFVKIATGKSTWDFQMQYSSFVHELRHLNVVFRICENVGFEDARGTNTNSGRPFYLGSEVMSNSKFATKHSSFIARTILQWLDSVVIAGDRVILHKNAIRIRNVMACFHSKF